MSKSSLRRKRRKEKQTPQTSSDPTVSDDVPAVKEPIDQPMANEPVTVNDNVSKGQWLKISIP